MSLQSLVCSVVFIWAKSIITLKKLSSRGRSGTRIMMRIPIVRRVNFTKEPRRYEFYFFMGGGGGGGGCCTIRGPLGC